MIIKIAYGIFLENIEITRPTTLRGMSSIAPSIRGKITNPNGKTLILNNITIRRASPFALYQRGGKLKLTKVAIIGTQRTDSIQSGTGIELFGGVKGVFNSVTLSGNNGVALYLNGNQTKVKATNLVVMNNKVHPEAIQAHIDNYSHSRLSAIDVAFGATLLLEQFTVYNNEMNGILARKFGKIYLKHGTVTSTRRFVVAGLEYIGGNNITALSNATIEIDNFVTQGAETCGIYGANAYIKGRDGTIKNNTIGVCYLNSPRPEYNILHCLRPYVFIRDNDVIYSADYLTIPDPNCVSINPPPSCLNHFCPGVVWSWD